MYIYAYFRSINPSEYAKLTVGIVGIDGKLFFPRCGASFFHCGASRIFCGCPFLANHNACGQKILGQKGR